LQRADVCLVFICSDNIIRWACGADGGNKKYLEDSDGEVYCKVTCSKMTSEKAG
jgi:hypothetical protein